MAPLSNWKKRLCLGCGSILAALVLLVLAVITAVFLILGKVPKSYPSVPSPLPPPDTRSATLGGELDGFSSPYLGHNGSWDGKGGAMFGASKIPTLDLERSLGLRWTFMPVHWRAMEPDGPVDLSVNTPPAWRELDAFVIAAHDHGLNILMQAPVIGGNAGGPPKWAGRREPHKSAPANMAAAADFAGRLAARYRPDGTLAKAQRWGATYGVRAWELDNEPESYMTSWKGQAGDYAEFVTLCARRIKEIDSQAVILAPAIAGGGNGLPWLDQTLKPQLMAGSPAFRARGTSFSIGPPTDVVSFHCYEGLETAFSKTDRTIELDFQDIRGVFEKNETEAPGFAYPRKLEFWHTEGNFDFLGVLSAKRRAAWRVQFFTRAFAVGIRKVCVMDPSKPAQTATRVYIRTLPNPFPMLDATKELSVLRGQPVAYRHLDAPSPNARRVWVLWAKAGTGDATVEIPVIAPQVTVLTINDLAKPVPTQSNRLRIAFQGDQKMAPPILVIDPGSQNSN